VAAARLVPHSALIAVAQSDTARDLDRLEVELKKLESEYNMFFAGRLARPPWETRNRVETLVKQYDRSYIQSYADRFRFSTLQARFFMFTDLWDRGLRAREEGRPGPFAHVRPTEPAARPAGDRILHVTSFQDPIREMEKLHDLYEAVADARRELGEATVPFHKFADLVRDQVGRLKAAGSSEVAFRVAMHDGKMTFTARGLHGQQAPDD
jgi:hypothetical protein